MTRFVVQYGDSSAIVSADTPVEAFEIIRNEYDSEWGFGAFDQYEVAVEEEQVLQERETASRSQYCEPPPAYFDWTDGHTVMLNQIAEIEYRPAIACLRLMLTGEVKYLVLRGDAALDAWRRFQNARDLWITA